MKRTIFDQSSILYGKQLIQVLDFKVFPALDRQGYVEGFTRSIVRIIAKHVYNELVSYGFEDDLVQCDLPLEEIQVELLLFAPFSCNFMLHVEQDCG